MQFNQEILLYGIKISFSNFYYCFFNLIFCFIMKNENVNNPSPKTNKASVSQTFHLASHKGWSNDLQTIVWNQEKKLL